MKREMNFPEKQNVRRLLCGRQTIRWLILLVMFSGLVPGSMADPGAGRGEVSGSSYELTNLPWRLKRALFEAAQLREEAAYQEAAAVFEKLLSEHPESDHVLLRVYLGNDLVMADRSREALAHYERATGLDSLYSNAWLCLGNAAYEAGEFQRSAEAFARARQYNDQAGAEVTYYIAVAWVMAGQQQRAIQYLRELVSGESGAVKLDWLQLLLTIEQELGQIDEAEATIASMLDLYGEDPSAWFVVYQYAATIGDYERATVALTIVGYLRQLSRAEKVSLADLYQTIGAFSRACDYYAKAFADSASTGEYERYASAALSAHNKTGVEDILLEALAAEPTARLWSLLGDHHFMAGNYQQSYEAFTESSRLDDTGGRCYLMMAYCALESGERSALASCLIEVNRFPDLEVQARELEKQLQ